MTLKEVFVNQDSITTCEHTVNMVPHDMTVSSNSHQEKEQEDWRSGGDGDKRESELFDINTRLSGE